MFSSDYFACQFSILPLPRRFDFLRLRFLRQISVFNFYFFSVFLFDFSSRDQKKNPSRLTFLFKMNIKLKNNFIQTKNKSAKNIKKNQKTTVQLAIPHLTFSSGK